MTTTKEASGFVRHLHAFRGFAIYFLHGLFLFELYRIALMTMSVPIGSFLGLAIGVGMFLVAMIGCLLISIPVKRLLGRRARMLIGA